LSDIVRAVLETFGRYELLRKIATGGMGQIYLARQKGAGGFQKLLVVKRILPHLSEDQQFINMFFDEARLAALLNHPNVAQIYDLGEVDSLHYIAMEFVQGDSLKHVLRRAKDHEVKIPVGLKCRIIADTAAGLGAAHQAKSPSGRVLSLIHRDVSPQNVLVGFNGSVKVIDFGVAKAVGKISTTLSGAIKGKYAYMSPEQARGEELDHRSDIFGLGILFWETLTLVRLFKRESHSETLKAVVAAKVPAPSSMNKEIPPALDSIVLKALSRNRDDRFQSAVEMQMELEDLAVHHRFPATSAHLAAFMRELYAEEMEEPFSTEPTQVHFESPFRSSSGSESGKAQSESAPSRKVARGILKKR
jgi:eukaryotic-like serine/threonine-protein kinase